jgi:pantetheine-phosphate adenylyltransferase
MPRVAVIPGSFDPVTLGHLDIVRRAAPLFDRLHVLVTHNPGKAALLPFQQRVSLLQQAIAEGGVQGDVVVASWSVGLLVDYCVEVGAQVIVKGIRSATDAEYETPMAIVNRDLAGVETLFLIGDPATSHVSSSLVRQVASLGGDITPYVPRAVAELLQPGRGAES